MWAVSTIAAALAKCSLFKDFTETGLGILASIATERAVPPGAPLFVENMVGDTFYVLKKGSVRVSMKGPDGADHALASLGEGEYLGELCLVSPDSPRLVSAVAEAPTEVIEIRHRDFLRLQSQKPQACLKLILAIAGSFGRKLADNRETLRAVLTAAARR